MKIEYRTGNLFDGEDVVFLAHCCNARGKMGSGFAKELRARYPGAYQVYRDEFERGGSDNHVMDMGSVIPYEADDSRIILNIIGQRNYGYDGARYVSYDALATAFDTLDTAARDMQMDKLFMPAIGSALAGGSWSIISSIIERHSTNYQPIVYLFDGVPPTT